MLSRVVGVSKNVNVSLYKRVLGFKREPALFAMKNPNTLLVKPLWNTFAKIGHFCKISERDFSLQSQGFTQLALLKPFFGVFLRAAFVTTPVKKPQSRLFYANFSLISCCLYRAPRSQPRHEQILVKIGENWRFLGKFEGFENNFDRTWEIEVTLGIFWKGEVQWRYDWFELTC